MSSEVDEPMDDHPATEDDLLADQARVNLLEGMRARRQRTWRPSALAN